MKIEKNSVKNKRKIKLRLTIHSYKEKIHITYECLFINDRVEI